MKHYANSWLGWGGKMAKIIKLAQANIRKSKGQAVSLLVFVLIAVFLLNIGLVLFLKTGEFFDEKVEILNAPHTVIIQSEAITTDEQKTYLENYSGSTDVEVQNVLATQGDYYLNGSKSTGILIFAKGSDAQKMNPPSLIGDSLPLDTGSIYVPYLMKVAGGYELGDTYKFILEGKKVEYKIAGFTEEMMFGAMMNSLYRYYLPDDAYNQLQKDVPSLSCTLQSVRLEDSDNGMYLEVDYTKEFFSSNDAEGQESSFLFILAIDNAKVARSTIPTIMAIIIVSFALILLVVCIIVIRFRIISSIEEGVKNIGVLKATGYTSTQIVSSIVLQFVSIAAAGGIIGLLLAQVLMPTIARLIESQSALVWNPGFNLDLVALSFILIIAVVFITSLIVAGRVKKLTPLIALKGGESAKKVKRNRLPLETAAGPLSLVLSIKQLLRNKKQAFMVTVIVALVTFTSVASMSIYYNIGVDPDEFIGLIAGELPDAGLLLKDNKKTAQVISNLDENPDVRKSFEYQNTMLLVGDINVTTFVTHDFSQLEGNMLVEGSYPKSSDEVAIGGNVSKLVEKKIGDKILITSNGKEREYVVSGIIQMVNGGGINMIITDAGVKEIQENYLSNQIYIYLNEGVDAATFLSAVEKSEGDIFSSTVNLREIADAQFGSYGDIFGMLTVVILIVTMLVILLVLYMIIRTSILRRKKEFGIQKALGFTNVQLMNQISLGFTPMIIVGVVAGGLLGYLGFNPMFVALTSGMGILKAELISPMLWTMITCAGIVILSYLISLLISMRIRRISPYSLITE